MADPLNPHSLRPIELKTLLCALDTGDPLLIHRDVDGGLQLHRLTPGSRLTIGRSRETDIALTWDAEVSKLHAEVYELAREWVVADDGLSKHGTFVNGARLVARRRLQHADRLRVGQTTLVFRHPRVTEATENRDTTIGNKLPQLSVMRTRVLAELCRPLLLHADVNPATNPQIADAVCLSTDTVKDHLSALARLFGHSHLKRGEQRAAIAHSAIQLGAVSIRDLE
jgi:predicted component of type VI protein secretion system